MKNNAEDFISLALWNGPTFCFLHCFDHRLFQGQIEFGQSQHSRVWSSSVHGQLANKLLGDLCCVPHCKLYYSVALQSLDHGWRTLLSSCFVIALHLTAQFLATVVLQCKKASHSQ